MDPKGPFCVNQGVQMAWKYRGYDISIKVVLEQMRKAGRTVTPLHTEAIIYWLEHGPTKFRLDMTATPNNREVLFEVQTWMAEFTLKLKPIRGENL